VSEPHQIIESDFTLANHGSLLILTACTEAAHAWVADHLPADRLTWARHGTVIEPRYVRDIVDGIREDGLTVTLD
jgi:hypothetical protein